MFCGFLTFSDDALYFEVGSTTWALISKLFFETLFLFIKNNQKSYDHVQNILFISTECPFHTQKSYKTTISISHFVRILLDHKGQ